MGRNFGILLDGIDKKLDITTPEGASQEYIRLEDEYNRLLVLLERNPNKRSKDNYRKKRKKIREKQNLLFPYFRGTGYVRIVQDSIGKSVSLQSIYKRYARFEANQKKKKEK